eukprot:Amastigsp_a8155_5.p3 type:complete len:121 gc:universal Amastigsp_a8155_5:353-715(+)
MRPLSTMSTMQLRPSRSENDCARSPSRAGLISNFFWQLPVLTTWKSWKSGWRLSEAMMRSRTKISCWAANVAHATLGSRIAMSAGAGACTRSTSAFVVETDTEFDGGLVGCSATCNSEAQ